VPHISVALNPPPLRRQGCIYVLLFDDNLFKVGQSQNIRQRVKSLHKNRFNGFRGIVDGWYSDDHEGWHLNEDRLKLFCNDTFGAPVVGHETFAGDYAVALSYAQSLPGCEP
jgi:hypothetical protein